MSELLRNTIEALENVMSDIKKDMQTKKINATGKTSNSLNVKEKENSKTKIKVQLLGSEILEFLNTGRAPGKFPPKDNIEQWVKDKPVDINPFLVSRKIAREGTEIFKDKKKGIQLEDKIINLRSELKQKSPEWAKVDVTNRLKKFTKEALKTRKL